MPSTPILVIGGATASDPGEKITGTASDNSQTDSYVEYGYNNLITENGGNLQVAPADAENDGNLGLTPDRDDTIHLGNATGVTDQILLYGFGDSILQSPHTALTNATVNITIEEGFGPGDNTVRLVNNGGKNQIAIYESNNTVKLTGATNVVSTSGVSAITVNGNATNSINTQLGYGQGGQNTITIGSEDDDDFGFNSLVYIGADASDVIKAGDENVTVETFFSPGFNQLTLGAGNNMVYLGGQMNAVTVGYGNNNITAGSGNDIVKITERGRRDIAQAGQPGAPAPTDKVTLAGSGNTLTATDENVTVAGAAGTGGTTVTLGDGTNGVTLGGDGNSVVVGNNTNTIQLTGNGNQVTVKGGGQLAFDTIGLGAGTGDTIALGRAGGMITGTGTGTGTGTTTTTQDATSRAAVTVALSGEGAITLGNGRDNVTVGNFSTVHVGNGDDTIVAGGFANIQVGRGDDTITTGPDSLVTGSPGDDTINLGDYSTATLTADPGGKATFNLGNVDSVGMTGGTLTVNATTNDTVYADSTSASSKVTFTDKDDLVLFGSNASGMAFLNPAGGNLVGVRATDSAGDYAGKIYVTNLTGSIVELEGLTGGIKAEALNSYNAVVDNLTRSGGNQILHLQGGGAVIIKGDVVLSASNFEFFNSSGNVVPHPA